MSKDFREYFNFESGLLYLNHGSLGVAPQCLWDEVDRLNRESELNPIKFYDIDRVDRLVNSRNTLAKFVDVNPDDLMVIDNVTIGVNAILKSLKFEKGDKILITDQEYGAYERLWSQFETRDGCRIVRIEIPFPYTDDEVFMEVISRQVDQKTRLIFVSHISSISSCCLPVKRICEFARSKNILSFIDGAHVPGQIPLDLEEIEPDFYVGNCHKWLYVPRVAGFMYVRPDLQDMLVPLITSWAQDTEVTSKIFADYSWLGTWNWSSIMSIPKAIEFFEENQIWDRKKAVYALIGELVKALQNSGATIMNPLWKEQRVQMLSFVLPDVECSAEEFQAEMKSRKVELKSWDFKGQLVVRVMFQPYHDSGDVKRLLDGLEFVKG